MCVCVCVRMTKFFRLCECVSLLTEQLFVIHRGGFLMLCVCIEVVYVCNFMCMYSALSLKLNLVLGELHFRKAI